MVKLARIAPELPVAELQTSLDYYRQKLGFDVAMQMPDYAIVERDDIATTCFRPAGTTFRSRSTSLRRTWRLWRRSFRVAARESHRRLRASPGAIAIFA